MDSVTIGLWVSGGMLVMVVLGMRVAFAAGLAGFVGLVWLRWNGFDYDPNRFWKAVQISVKVAGLTPHSKVSAQVLSLIPVFIMIGYLAYYARLTMALFEAAKRWIAWVPGGLAVSTVFATAGFAAVSGASVATAAVFARIAIPEMLKIGYNKQFAAGVVAAGGTLASLIPPSAILVIYAIIVEQDVGKLLLAGFVPGAFSAVVYGCLIVGIAVVFKSVGPPVGGFTWKERFESLPRFAHYCGGGDHHFLCLQSLWRCLGHSHRGWSGWRLYRFRYGTLSRHAAPTIERSLARDGKTHCDDFHNHLGGFDLCALFRLCKTARCLF